MMCMRHILEILPTEFVQYFEILHVFVTLRSNKNVFLAYFGTGS